MKRHFLLLLALLLTVTTLSAANAQHKKIHGFFLRNAGFGDYMYGFGQLYMDAPDDPELTFPYTSPEAIYAGACVNDVYYTFGYTYEQNGPEPTQLIAYDMISGKRTEIGEYTDMVLFRVMDATYDYTTSTFYAVGYENGIGQHLYTVDLTSGKMTEVGELSVGVGTIAANKEGQLYGVSNDGTLYKVSKTTAACEKVCVLTGYNGLMSSSESMEFDLSNGLLYWAANVYSTEDKGRSTYLLQIDLDKTPVEINNLGEIGTEANFYAMYIPFLEAGDNAPAAPTGFTVKAAAEGKKEATLTWTNPTTNYGGQSLTGLQSVTVLREGTPIATIETTEPGQQLSYTDTSVPRDSSYRYTIYATNASGDGERANAFAYVGHDIPDAPQNVMAEVGDGCQSITFTWDEPTKGYYDGYFTTDGLVYDVIRITDNRTVATGLTERTFTDTSMRRLGRYDYSIVARNDYGSKSFTTTDGFVIGKALDIPLTENFNDLTYFNNRFQVYDANDDGLTWSYSNWMGSYQFGNSLNCIDYLNGQNSDLYSTEDADEWVMTPPLNFEKDKKYLLRISARAVENDILEVTTGRNNEIESQAQFATITIDSWDGTENPAPTKNYEVQLPAGMDGIQCVGLHLITPAPTDPYSPEFLQITSISVEEGTASGIADITKAESSASASVYGLDGVLLHEGASVAEAATRLPAGVYIVKQGARTMKVTLK